MRKTVSYLLLAIVLVSCAYGKQGDWQGKEIAFSAVAGHTTRGIIQGTDYPRDIPFSVSAWADDGTPVFASETARWDGEAWRTGKPYSWPRDGHYSFTAFSPADAAAVATQSGIVATYTADGKTDLCFASESASCGSHPRLVPLVFNHALSQVSFKAKALAWYSYTVSEGTLTQENTITVRLDTLYVTGLPSRGTFHQEGVRWDVDSTLRKEYPLSGPAEMSWNAENSPEAQQLGTLLAVPQRLTHAVVLHERHTVHVITRVTDASDGSVRTTEYDIPRLADLSVRSFCKEWEPGYKYTFHVAVGLGATQVTVALTDWTETNEKFTEE